MKHIRKGIAKRAAMTRAYSCGQKKMAESMYSDCYQYGYTEQYNISEYDCIDLSGQIIKAIEEVCPGPLTTMKYLQKLADQEINNWMGIYGTDRGHAIEWVTPSGFPVVYECYRTRPAKVDCYALIRLMVKSALNMSLGKRQISLIGVALCAALALTLFTAWTHLTWHLLLLIGIATLVLCMTRLARMLLT